MRRCELKEVEVGRGKSCTERESLTDTVRGQTSDPERLVFFSKVPTSSDEPTSPRLGKSWERELLSIMYVPMMFFFFFIFGFTLLIYSVGRRTLPLMDMAAPKEIDHPGGCR